MNKKIIFVTIALLLFSAILLNACQSTPTPNPTPQTTTSPYEALIRELEAKIIELQNDQTLSEEESQKQIEELEERIEQLRAEATRTTTTTTSTKPRSIFIYSLEEGKAVITGYTGDDEHLVIPSHIDGLAVYSIASRAFEDYSFKSVIISEGVEEIDWFAFYRCENLESITIPKSVRKIGHSAFEGSASKFTIYCQDASFAKSYAQSYGIAYAII